MAVTSWRCTLTDSKIKVRQQPRIELPTIYYELAFVLLTYAYALVNRAYQATSTAEPSEVKLNQACPRICECSFQAADSLCRAAGVFYYIYDTILAKLYTSLSLIKCKEPIPVDLTREVISTHHK
jgi:hypothetical protein